MSAFRLLSGRLREDRLPVVLLAVLVAVSAFLAAASPRLFNAAADAGLRAEVAGASAVERSLQFGRITRLGGSADGGMAAVDEVESEIDRALPTSVRAIVSDRSHFARSITWRIPERPSERPGFLTLHVQDGLADEISLVEGRMPAPETRRVPAPDAPPGSVAAPEGRDALLFEVALSTRTADELGVALGDRLHLVPDPDDPLVGSFGVPEAAAVELVGIYEVDDPAADFWAGDFALERPNRVPVGISVVLIYATALVAPDAYPALTQLDPAIRYTFRYAIDPRRLDAGMVEQLAVDLRRMAAGHSSFATMEDPANTTLQTGLDRLVDRYLAERRTAEAVLTTAAIGPVVVAVVAIAVLALLVVQRRRGALALLRGRGTSVGQLVGSHIGEGLLVTVVPGALAAWLAVLIVDGRGTSMSWVAAALVALVTIVILVGATLPLALAPLRRLDRDETPTGGASPRRLALEAFAVVLAAGGVILLRERGLAGGSAAGALAGVDPLMALVPALVGIAVGILTVRLYPLPVRMLCLAAAGGRGLVLALGLRRAERQSGSGHLPLIVLLLTIAIGTFSSTILATLDRGQVNASWEAVGAAHRVSSTDGLSGDLNLIALDGVEAVAAAHETQATIGIAGRSRIPLMAVDAAEYRAVTAGTPIETRLPSTFFMPTGEARPGTLDAPIPAIVSSTLANASTPPLAVGDTFELTMTARFATFAVADVRRRMPALGDEETFVVVPREPLAEGLIDRPLAPTTLFVRAPAEAADSIRAATTTSGPDVRVESQAAHLEALRGRPLVEAVRSGFAVALAVSLGYAALAVIVSMLMSGAARARETAHLRMLGVGATQVIGLAILEHTPPVIFAVLSGLALGVAVGWLVLPGLDLGGLIGTRGVPALTVDAGQLVALTLALAAVVLVGIALTAWTQHRVDPARAAREGAE